MFMLENSPHHSSLYPHNITQQGNNHIDVFFDDADKATYLSLLTTYLLSLKDYCEKMTVEIWAYCLMTKKAKSDSIREVLP